MKATNTPIHAPLYPSDLKYYASNVRGVMLVCEADEDKIKKHLENTPFNYYTNKVIVEGGFFGDCTMGDFCNSGIVIPVEYKGKYGGYYSYCYVDTDSSVALGREPYGYPKKSALISYEEKDGGKVDIVTTRNNVEIMRVEASLTDKQLEESIVTPSPHLLLQIIPDVDGKELLVNRIIERNASLPPTKIIDRKMADAKLTIGESKDDPLYLLGISDVLQAYFTVVDFHWAPGKVIADLNKK